MALRCPLALSRYSLGPLSFSVSLKLGSSSFTADVTGPRPFRASLLRLCLMFFLQQTGPSDPNPV